MPIDGRGNVEVKVGKNATPLTVEVVRINQAELIQVTFAVPEAPVGRYQALFGGLAARPS